MPRLIHSRLRIRAVSYNLFLSCTLLTCGAIRNPLFLALRRARVCPPSHRRGLLLHIRSIDPPFVRVERACSTRLRLRRVGIHACIIVLRGLSDWQRVVPALTTYGRVCLPRNWQSAYVTPRNMPEGFDQVVAAVSG